MRIGIGSLLFPWIWSIACFINFIGHCSEMVLNFLQYTRKLSPSKRSSHFTSIAYYWMLLVLKGSSIFAHWVDVFWCERHVKNVSNSFKRIRLIWVFAGYICHFAAFVMRRLICICSWYFSEIILLLCFVLMYKLFVHWSRLPLTW